MLLPVVLHPDVTDFLRTEFLNNLKDYNYIWKCIDKLRRRNFDGGLRVKKLKGISKNVWEARVTRAIRLIFTYESSINLDTKEPQKSIAVQDICLDHDDVSRRAARIRTPDAQWLDLEEVETIGSLKTDCEELSEDEQSAVWEAEEEDLQVQDNIGDELSGNIQWQVLESESDWHKAIVEQDKDLPLKLSVEESNLAKHYGHLLLSGSAGTGKTTVGLYRLLKSLETLPAGKRLYVAYNPILVKETSKQFQRLVDRKITEVESFQFQTIQDLCSQILLQADKTYIEYNEVNYQFFEGLYSQQRDNRTYPPALVWDEIRSIIKGSYLKTYARLSSLSEYEALGKKRSSVIAQEERPNIYRIAQWYQKYLTANKRFDEIDLARDALEYVQQRQHERYQMIVCDEVQDLTELQLHLLMQLLDTNGHLFFAGDLNQMISPSGFRWEDLRSLFRSSEYLVRDDRRVKEEKLQFNFRSISSLVRLANQLLILRSRLLNEKTNDFNQLRSNSNESTQLDKPARIINAPLENIELIVKQLYSGDAVLVRTQEQKEEISQRLDSSLVFTIEEAKGLEFDTVFLVEFFLPHQNLWQKAINGIPALKEKEIPQLRLEINLLYVAITRARRILNVWENDLSIIWNQEELMDLVQQINAESVKMERHESTVQDWREQGLSYLEQEWYRQALECFENSGDFRLQWRASAKLALQEEEYTKAAEFFAKLEDWQQAASLLQKEAQWSQAAIYWGKAGNINEQQICEARALESERKWEDAALSWEKLKNFQKARKCWLKSDNELKKNEIRIAIAKEFEIEKKWQQAIEQYRLAGMLQEIARCQAEDFANKKQWQKAAEQWQEAAKQYRLAGMPKTAARCKAKEFKIKKQWQKAAEQYRLAGMPKTATRCRAKDFENRKQWQQAAVCWGKLGNVERQQICENKEAARCRANNFVRNEQWLKATEQYELAGMNKEVTFCEAKSFEIEKQWSKAATQYALAGMPAKAAKLFEQEQQWSKAAEQYELAGMPEQADNCRARLLVSS